MKTVLFIAMSLDGYIAKHDFQVDWLRGDSTDVDNMGSYPEFFQTIDTVLVGYTTYEQIINKLSPSQWAYPNKRTFVFTNKDIEECQMPSYQIKDNSFIQFTNEEPQNVIKKLKTKGGQNIWVCGGAILANQCIEQNLVDIYHISIIPTILGDGIPLFHKIHHEKRLELLTSYNYNGIVDLVYMVQK